MGTVREARLTAEQLLEGRSLRLCASGYRLAVNKDIVSPVTRPLSAEKPNSGAWSTGSERHETGKGIKATIELDSC